MLMKFPKNRVKTVIEIEDATVLAFTIDRITPTGKFFQEPINAPPELILKKGRQLFLRSMVLYTGGMHYICYFHCQGAWYEYNDLGPTFTRIGSFDDMMDRNPQPDTHATIFLYSMHKPL